MYVEVKVHDREPTEYARAINGDEFDAELYETESE
jgi:hypothetical protein